jgi:hypothetical protein
MDEGDVVLAGVLDLRSVRWSVTGGRKGEVYRGIGSAE